MLKKDIENKKRLLTWNVLINLDSNTIEDIYYSNTTILLLDEKKFYNTINDVINKIKNFDVLFVITIFYIYMNILHIYYIIILKNN